MQGRGRMPRDLAIVPRLMPLLVGVMAAFAAWIGASVQGLPVPLDVAGVFVALGVATAWLARATPLRGAFLLLLLAATVIAVVYGG